MPDKTNQRPMRSIWLCSKGQRGNDKSPCRNDNSSQESVGVYLMKCRRRQLPPPMDYRQIRRCAVGFGHLAENRLDAKPVRSLSFVRGDIKQL